jgi:uncharacterized protein YciI
MTKAFVVMYSYSADATLQDATRPLHLEHLRRLVDDGALIASGPWDRMTRVAACLFSMPTIAQPCRRSWTGIRS